MEVGLRVELEYVVHHLGDEVVELDEIRARLPLGAVHLLRLVAPLVRVRVRVGVRVRVTLTCLDSSRPCRKCVSRGTKVSSQVLEYATF